MKCQEKPVQILLCPLFSLHEIYIYIYIYKIYLSLSEMLLCHPYPRVPPHTYTLNALRNTKNFNNVI